MNCGYLVNVFIKLCIYFSECNHTIFGKIPFSCPKFYVYFSFWKHVLSLSLLVCLQCSYPYPKFYICIRLMLNAGSFGSKTHIDRYTYSTNHIYVAIYLQRSKRVFFWWAKGNVTQGRCFFLRWYKKSYSETVGNKYAPLRTTTLCIQSSWPIFKGVVHAYIHHTYLLPWLWMWTRTYIA